MPSTLVPKVSITEAAGALAVPRKNQVIIGIIGPSASGTANTVYEINSVAEAENTFGSNTAHGANLVKMIRKAFEEGASIIKAVSIGAPTIDSATSASQGVLTADSEAGDTTITVADATIYSASDVVYIGTNSAYEKEERRVVASGSGTTVTFTTALTFKHYIGEDAKIVTEKVASDYTDGITVLEQDEDKNLVVADLNDDTNAAALVTMCENSTENFNAPCVFVRAPEIGDTASTVIANAIAHNNKRAVQIFPLLTEYSGKNYSPGETSAAFVGAIAGNGVPKLNHNFTEFSGPGGVSAKITDMDALIEAGVTPIELKHNTIHIVRFVTTQTKVDSIPNTVWQEGSIRLNLDYIEGDIAEYIQLNFMQKGNTAETREAIKRAIISRLDTFVNNSILVADEVTGVPAYKDPVVAKDATDDTKVTVEIAVSPGKPLNFIPLSFKVYV